ncbi:GPR endopeptidase [Kyrpidia spormannii]|uniref:Germination protease n=1 Tax=Kyrpidia spormannii TaxID=2055160 RepID=A0A2K8N7A7_9BACL|nr:GPR endopeptidase [Kyrpidia spormannii]ATY85216.1 GPR endopeptidase [Kyrpidia spormannii]
MHRTNPYAWRRFGEFVEWTHRGQVPEPQGEQQASDPRVDLAVEAHELAGGGDIPGVDVETWSEEGITVTRMHVQDEQAARRVGKEPGRYSTLEVPGLRKRDPDLQERVSARMAEELARFIELPDTESALVVGLGNWNVTADSLGPLVVEKLFVTRHLFHHIPDLMGDGYRSVSAVAPGVLGITGIETMEIVRGIVEHVKPKLVVAVDALASRSTKRVNTTIQIADTGVHPGSGVGNRRKGLTRETLGVPVIAIGVPTVVEATTIIHDALDYLLQRLSREVSDQLRPVLNTFDVAEKQKWITDILDPLGDNLVVTPKEIDAFVDDAAHIVATGLNVAFHPAISLEDAALFTH